MSATSGRLFCDGGSRGNPGPAGAGALLVDGQGGRLDARSEFLGRATNNIAEYRGLLLGLSLAQAHGVHHLEVNLDSELIVRQINGVYKVRDPQLRLLWQEAMRQLQKIPKWQVKHIPREQNQAADQLVNEAIDRGNKTEV